MPHASIRSTLSLLRVVAAEIVLLLMIISIVSFALVVYLGAIGGAR